MSLSNETSVRAEFEKWWEQHRYGRICGSSGKRDWEIWQAAYAAGMARMREMAANLAYEDEPLRNRQGKATLREQAEVDGACSIFERRESRSDRA
jgi:hypothetical protein